MTVVISGRKFAGRFLAAFLLEWFAIACMVRGDLFIRPVCGVV
jgi:hypothetical protein